MNISSFEQDALYTHWTYYAIPFCKYNIVLIVARAQYNICICLEHSSVFMHQPPPVFPFEFPAISMKVIIAFQTAAVKAAKQAQALQTAIAVNACSLPEKSRFASGSKNSKQPVILFAMVCLIINHLSATNPAATLQAQIVITAAITQITQLSNCSFGRTLAAYDAAKHKSDIPSSIAPISLSVCNLHVIEHIIQSAVCIHNTELHCSVLNRKQCSLYSNPRQSDNICRIVMQCLISALHAPLCSRIKMK